MEKLKIENWKDWKGIDENYDDAWGWPNIDFKDKIVLDLGADWGSTAYYFRQKGASLIIAIEGELNYFTELCKNAEKIGNVIPVHMWIDTPRQIMALMEKYGPDIVKVDIEREEINLLAIMPHILKKVKIFLIEVHAWIDVHDAIIARFQSLGFKITEKVCFSKESERYRDPYTNEIGIVWIIVAAQRGEEKD